MASTLKDFGELTFTVEELDEDILRLRKEKEKAKEREKQREQAEVVRDVFQSYIEAGFSEEQAWEIFITLLNKQ